MAARREILQNNSETTLNGSINDSTTTVTVTDGAVFPSTGNFRILVEAEIMLVTARSTHVLTVVRGIEGSTNVAHSDLVAVVHVLTEDGLEQYLRQNLPHHNGGRTPFLLVDASNTILTSSSFTEVNGSSNPTPVDNADGSIFVGKDSTTAAVDWSLYCRSAPSTPYTVIASMRFLTLLTGSGSIAGPGIGFRESGTGKFVVLRYHCIANGAGNVNFGTSKYTDAATFSADYKFDYACNANDLIWMKITDNATNLIFYISLDGINWQQVDSRTRTDFMAGGPDQIFWGINNQNNVTYDAMCSLLAWDENA